MSFRLDPGACPICGAAHTTCTGRAPDPIESVMVPARDSAVVALPLVAETVQKTLPEGSFTTGTYRGKKKP